MTEIENQAVASIATDAGGGVEAPIQLPPPEV